MMSIIYDARHLHSGIGTYILNTLSYLVKTSLAPRLKIITSEENLLSLQQKLELHRNNFIISNTNIYSLKEQFFFFVHYHQNRSL